MERIVDSLRSEIKGRLIELGRSGLRQLAQRSLPVGSIASRHTSCESPTRGDVAAAINYARETGILAPGWLADLEVISGDYFGAAEDRIADIRSELTPLGSQVVHASGTFAGRGDGGTA